MRALDALLAHQNVSHAADSCFVSQSTMRGYLKQLRGIFSDPLLRRGSDGEMQLTKKAITLIEPTKQFLLDVENLLIYKPQIDLSNIAREVTIALPEYAITLLLPKLLMLKEALAPGLTIQCVQIDTIDSIDHFLTRSFDLAVVFKVNSMLRVHVMPLLTDEIVCVARKRHPLWESRDSTTLPIMSRYSRILWPCLQHFDTLLFGDTHPPAIVVPNGVHILQIIHKTDHIALTAKKLHRSLLPALFIQNTQSCSTAK